MLNYIRKYTGNWGLKIIYFVVALTFLGGFGGIFGIMKSCGTGLSEGTIAVVNRDALSVDDFSRAYTNTINAYSRQMKGELTQQMITKLNLPDRVLNNLISSEVAQQQAHAIGFKVTRQELMDQISHTSAFLNKDHQFDPRIYYAVLRENNITPDNFQSDVSNDILMLKLKNLFYDSVFLTGRETKILDTLNNTQVSLGYCEVTPSMLKPPAGSTMSVQDYAAQLANTCLQNTDHGKSTLQSVAGVSYGTTGPFALQGADIPGIGNAPDIARNVLALNKGEVLNKVVSVDGNLFVVWLESRESVQQADNGAPAPDRSKYTIAQAAYTYWISQVESSMTIQKNTAVLARFTQTTD